MGKETKRAMMSNLSWFGKKQTPYSSPQSGLSWIITQYMYGLLFQFPGDHAAMTKYCVHILDKILKYAGDVSVSEKTDFQYILVKLFSVLPSACLSAFPPFCLSVWLAAQIRTLKYFVPIFCPTTLTNPFPPWLLLSFHLIFFPLAVSLPNFTSFSPILWITPGYSLTDCLDTFYWYCALPDSFQSYQESYQGP